MKNIFRKLTLYSVALAAVSFSSCSLEENNPAGFTKENLATSIEGYETSVILLWKDISMVRIVG
jgi:hypothetical protein